MSTKIDVVGISPLPFGEPIPISYDDSSTRMIAILFGFICFFLLSAFIMFLWWPIRNAKITHGDSITDVESLPSDGSMAQNEGNYKTKIPRAWIETMKRCPDDQFDSRLQQLQKEALENSFDSDFSHHQVEQKQSESFLSGGGALTGGQWSSEAASVQQSAEQESHAKLAGILEAGEKSEGQMCAGGVGGVSRVESTRKMFERIEKTEHCAAGGGETSMMIRQVKLELELEEMTSFCNKNYVTDYVTIPSGIADLDGERDDIKKENFLKIYQAYRQYLMLRYDQSKA